MPIDIASQNNLVDTVLSIQATQLPANSQVRFEVDTQDAFGKTWTSHAVFATDNKGTIDLSEQAPLSGSYSVKDTMGLIWSMRPENNDDSTSMFVAAHEKSLSIHIKAKIKDKIIAQRNIQRIMLNHNIEQRDIEEETVKGRFFVPQNNSLSNHAILLCAGSSGGIISQLSMASLLASHGYTVLVQAYFNFPGLVKECYEVPLETFQQGVDWLQQQPEVDADNIILMAPSKGAEAILAATAYQPEMKIKGVIAISPSSVVWQGIGKGKPRPKSSWSFQGKALPFFKMDGWRVLPQFIRTHWIRRLKLAKRLPSLTRIRLRSVYANVRQSYKQPDKVIPVENIPAPLLLIAGKKDALWPADIMCQQIKKRRQTSAYALQDEYCIYPDAGHIFPFPYLPSTIPWMAPPKGQLILNFGGTLQGNVDARVDAWQKILTFLHKHTNRH